MKEIKKPYNVYLITKEDGNEDLKFIQGIYEEPYKTYLGLYILTDDEVKFPLLDFNTGQISLNETLKKQDDRKRAIENLENYYKENPEQDIILSTPIRRNSFIFLKLNEDNYIFDFELEDQINIMSQIILNFEKIKLKCIKNYGEKEYIEFSLEEVKNIYLLLYNNLKDNK
jgi:hypothetical protein